MGSPTIITTILPQAFAKTTELSSAPAAISTTSLAFSCFNRWFSISFKTIYLLSFVKFNKSVDADPPETNSTPESVLTITSEIVFSLLRILTLFR